MDMGRVHPWIGLGRVGLGFIFFWVGLGWIQTSNFSSFFRKMSVKRSNKYTAIIWSSKRVIFTFRLPVSRILHDARPCKFQLLVGLWSFGAITHLTIQLVTCHRLRVVFYTFSAFLLALLPIQCFTQASVYIISLPHDIRLEACTNSFKRKLKTFLFERYYC